MVVLTSKLSARTGIADSAISPMIFAVAIVRITVFNLFAKEEFDFGLSPALPRARSPAPGGVGGSEDVPIRPSRSDTGYASGRRGSEFCPR